MKTGQRKGKVNKTIGIAVVLMLLLIAQACGGGSGGPQQAGGQPAASGNGGNSPETPAGGNAGGEQTPTATAPPTLNFGYVGQSRLPLGTEGWGIEQQIIQDELKQYGIEEVNIIRFATGPDLNESLISGRLDIALSGDTPAILARSAGAATRLFSQPSIVAGSMLVGQKELNEVEDLKGGKVGVVRGSIHYRFLVGLLEQKNVLDDVEIININTFADSEAALVRGEIDAYVSNLTTASAHELVEQGYARLARSTDYPDLLTTMVIVAAEKYLEKFPELPQAWEQAYTKAYADLIANEEQYYAFQAELTGTTVELTKLLQPIDTISPVLLSDEGLARLKGSKDFWVAQGAAERDFDVDAWVVK